MYKIIKTNISQNIIKYQFFKDDANQLTSIEFINFLKEFGEEFRSFLTNANRELGSAYLWECHPISQSTINQPFEFVIIKSGELNNITQNYASFWEHIKKSISDGNNDVCSFLSLGRDANLVVPIPREGKDYKNLAEFVSNSSIRQWKTFWKEVGNKLLAELEKNDDPKWLSTHGLGVPYLHVRIDTRPKYYSFQEYRDPNFRSKIILKKIEQDLTQSQKQKEQQLEQPKKPWFHWGDGGNNSYLIRNN